MQVPHRDSSTHNPALSAAVDGGSTRWHALSRAAAAAALQVDTATGLSSAEAACRLTAHGPNTLADAPKRSRLLLFLDQFRSLLAYVLMGAALLAAAVGDVKDPVVIAAVLIANAVIGFIQTHRAERSMEALKRMLVLHAQVRRDGQVIDLPSQALVPGDIVLLDAGDRVPADGRLLVAANLAVDESALTGESVPVDKIADALPDADLPLSEHANLAFMNTAVARGRAELLVTRTGMDTEIGRVAAVLASAKAQPTPLQRQLDGVGRRIAGLAAVASVAVLLLAVAQGDAWTDATLTAVALAVAAIPEGLPAVVAVTLAVGARRMARRNAIVKRLASVETLGCTTVICTDKTGTLTMNEMTARAVLYAGRLFEVEGHGYDPAGTISAENGAAVPDLVDALVPAVLCNNTTVTDDSVVGDPTEAALIVLARKARVPIDVVSARYRRVAEIPFDSAHKFMATFHRADQVSDEGVLLCVKGAPEVLLPRCATIATERGPIAMDDVARDRIRDATDTLARRGLRLLAVARRELDTSVDAEALEEAGLFELVRDLELQVLVGIFDPPRPEARAAVADCRAAGIAVKMITGDHAATARAIAADLGIGGEVLTGADLDRVAADDLAHRIGTVGVFARVAPEHKVQIVEALRRDGNVVAMTGDGVNDAAALKAADIGVAMGIAGTDVTREAAEMVLADDNFATIVGAVRRGRTIYDNILKFVRFQLSTNVGAILTILGARILGLPTPFTPIQVLWVNLIMDGPPAIALGLDPAAADTMRRPPRDPTEPVLPARRLVQLAYLGLVMATGTIAVFAYARDREPDVAITMAFTTFVLFQVVNAFNARSETTTVLSRQSLTNWRLWVALGLVVALQVAAVSWGPLTRIFDTTPLDRGQWLLCAATALLLLVAEEIRKAAARVHRRHDDERNRQ